MHRSTRGAVAALVTFATVAAHAADDRPSLAGLVSKSTLFEGDDGRYRGWSWTTGLRIAW